VAEPSLVLRFSDLARLSQTTFDLFWRELGAIVHDDLKARFRDKPRDTEPKPVAVPQVQVAATRAVTRPQPSVHGKPLWERMRDYLRTHEGPMQATELGVALGVTKYPREQAMVQAGKHPDVFSRPSPGMIALKNAPATAAAPRREKPLYAPVQDRAGAPGGCVHHWDIDSQNGPLSTGRCRKCGAVRKDFRNSLPPVSFNGEALTGDVLKAGHGQWRVAGNRKSPRNADMRARERTSGTRSFLPRSPSR